MIQNPPLSNASTMSNGPSDNPTTSISSSSSSIIVPAHPIPGLALDVRAKPDGNGTDREWLELGKIKPSSQPVSQPKYIVDDGNLLIGLMGGNEQDHQLMLNNVSHTFPLRIISYQSTYRFPPTKSRTISYDADGQSISGLVKTHWIVKQKYLLPAVVCMFFNWDDNANFDLQENALAQSASKLRQELTGRDTRVLCVLIKQSKFQSVEEETQLANRLILSLRIRAGIETGHRNVTFWLNQPSDVASSTKRLENQCAEIARDYYRNQITRIQLLNQSARALRLSRPAQAMLYIRHQLKIGYFSEALLDSANAIKSYGNSYTALTNYVKQLPAAGLSSSFAHEIKQVALIVNYRMCRLLLNQGRCQDAVDQFNTHIAIMQKCVGLPDCAFSHDHWLSQQHHLFGDLLEGATSANTNKSFHSGYYYQTAANYAQKRKAHAQIALARAKVANIQLVTPSLLAPSPYLGQARLPNPVELARDDRAIAGVASFYVTSTQAEDLTRSLLSLEAPVDHSSQTIGLLNKAYQSFKKQASVRMIIHVASQMATEYFSAANYEMAQSYFDRIASTYRQECWFTVLTATLMTVYQCAEKTGKLDDLVDYSLELLSEYATTTFEQKERIHLHIVELLRSQSSNQSNPSKQSLKSVHELPLSYHLIDVSSFFLTTISGVISVNQPIDIVLTLHFRFPLPVSCSSIKLEFNHAQYTMELIPDQSTSSTEGQPSSPTGGDSAHTFKKPSTNSTLSQADIDALVAIESSDPSSNRIPANLTFHPRHPKSFRLRFIAHVAISDHNVLPSAQSHSQEGLQLTHVLCSVALDPACVDQTDRCLLIRSPVNKGDNGNVLKPVFRPTTFEEEYNVHNRKRKLKDRRTAAEKEAEAASIVAAENARQSALATRMTSVPIVPTQPRALVSLDHPAPPLLNEFYPINITIQSQEDDMNRGQVTFKSFFQGEDQTMSKTAQFFVLSDNAMEPLTGSMPLPTLHVQSTYSLTIFARFSTAVTQVVEICVVYSNDRSNDHNVSKQLTLTPRESLLFRYKVLSDGLPGITAKVLSDTIHPLAASQLSALHVEVENVSPHAIALTGVRVDWPLDKVTSLDQVDDSSANSPNNLVNPRNAAEASARFHERHDTNPALLGRSESVAVLLASGERFVHVNYFTALTPGRLNDATISVDWCRVSVHKKSVQIEDFSEKLTEKQRDDLLKRLVAEQRIRAGDRTVVRPAIAPSKPADRSPIPNDSHPDTHSPVDALQRELAGAEADKKEAQEESINQSKLDPEREVMIKKFMSSSMSMDQAINEIADDASLAPWVPVSLSQPLPSFDVRTPFVEIESDHPSFVEFGGSFDFTLTLVNYTDALHEIEFICMLPEHDNAASHMPPRMLVSGDRSGVIRLLPHDRWPITLQCVSLDVGHVPLPHMKFRMTRTGQLLNHASEFAKVWVNNTAM